jgi:hypothetical protein
VVKELMLKLLNKILDSVANTYYNIKLWYYLWQESKQLKHSKSQIKRITIMQNQTHELYLQGLGKVKKLVNTKAKTKAEYEQTLSTIDNLITAAINREDEEGQNFINNLKQVYIYTHEQPKEVMVDQRIKAMYELQSHREKREKLRAKRKKSKS